jgi:hypothetical protein
MFEMVVFDSKQNAYCEKGRPWSSHFKGSEEDAAARVAL